MDCAKEPEVGYLQAVIGGEQHIEQQHLRMVEEQEEVVMVMVEGVKQEVEEQSKCNGKKIS